MTFDTREKSQAAGEPVLCFRFSMGTTIWRYTSADSRFTVDVAGDGPQNYVPGVVKAGAVEYSEEDEQGQIEIRLLRSDAVSLLSVIGAPVKPILLQIYKLHAGDSETKLFFDGEVASVSYETSEAVLTCQSVFEALRQRVPSWGYQVRCPWALYSTLCGLNRASFLDSGTVISTSGRTVTAAIFGTRPDGRYVTGYMELANGDVRYIVKHVGTTITLRTPFPSLPNGTAFSAYRGCKHTEDDCETEFNNLPNHGGFPRIPGRNPLSQRIV